MALAKKEKRVLESAKSGILFSVFISLFVCCFLFIKLLPAEFNSFRLKIHKETEIKQTLKSKTASAIELDTLAVEALAISIALAKTTIMLGIIFLVFYNILLEKKNLSHAIISLEVELHSLKEIETRYKELSEIVAAGSSKKLQQNLEL